MANAKVCDRYAEGLCNCTFERASGNVHKLVRQKTWHYDASDPDGGHYEVDRVELCSNFIVGLIGEMMDKDDGLASFIIEKARGT